ncbi:hypothetical protein H1R20_g5044, partial [Candolleomyces eurysporus]
MPEQPSSQAQENHSDSFQTAREVPVAPVFIYIDQSYTIYNTYRNSQNRTTTETTNSNNVSSTQARNSTLNGDSKWTFQTERPNDETPGQSHPTTSGTQMDFNTQNRDKRHQGRL